MKHFSYIKDNIISCDISYRGGSMMVDVSEFFQTELEDARMGASQNYLGGGIAGAIEGGAMFYPQELKTEEERERFHELLDDIKKYFYNLNNGGGDDYMQSLKTDYDYNQKLPRSAY